MGVLPMNLFRYAKDKLEYSKTIAGMRYREGSRYYWYKVYMTMMREKMTMVTRYEDEHYFHMPYLGVKGILIVRKIPQPNPQILRVGDLVLHKDPTDLDNHLIRRIAAFGGCEMPPTDNRNAPCTLGEKANIPSTLAKDECWVVSDNLKILPKEFHDSRTFGPLYMPHIIGRPIYMKNEWGPSPVWNSFISQQEDEALIEVELEYQRKIVREAIKRQQEDDDDDDDDGYYYDDEDDDDDERK